MNDEVRANRYRRLVAQLSRTAASDLLDKLQILALTNPEALLEFEAFIDRTVLADHPAREPMMPFSR